MIYSKLRSIVKGTDIVSDEVYEHLIFDNIPTSPYRVIPICWKEALRASSICKVYHCTGWKLGYCISSPAFMKESVKSAPVQLLFVSQSVAGSISPVPD